jgi:hypothetical protein
MSQLRWLAQKIGVIFRHIGAKEFSAYRSQSGQDGHLESNRPFATLRDFVPVEVAVGRRRIEMFQYRQVLARLRRGDSDREIARGKYMGRRQLAALRVLHQLREHQPALVHRSSPRSSASQGRRIRPSSSNRDQENSSLSDY